MVSRLIALQPSNSLPSSQRRVEMDTAFQIIMSLMILSTIGILIHTYISKGWQHFFSSKPPPQTLCHRCRYFSDNRYLKCALHPETALTEQAIDCRDYCPNSKTKSVE